jgi:hypothetical protein
MRELASALCRRTGNLCIEPTDLPDPVYKTLVGMELAVLETFHIVVSEHGLRGLKECLEDEECTSTIVETSSEVLRYSRRGSYYFNVDVDGLHRVIRLLRIVNESLERMQLQ